MSTDTSSSKTSSSLNYGAAYTELEVGLAAETRPSTFPTVVSDVSTAAGAAVATASNATRSTCTGVSPTGKNWLDWSLVRELPYPEGEKSVFGGEAKPVPVSANEKVTIATTASSLFPIGFYNLTSSKRGVTRGRGPWRGRETLCLLHCSADKAGCKYKARYCRTETGVEIWSNGAHDSMAHQSARRKRGLTPEARAVVTKNHQLGQVQLLNLLVEQGLVPADATKDELKKIKHQIKRRRLTVKDQIKSDKLAVTSMVARALEKERETEKASAAAADVTEGSC